MALGLRVREELRGSWHRPATPGDERPAAFSLELLLPATRALRTGAVVAAVGGSLRAEGLCARAEVEEGALDLGGLARERRLAYRFAFRGDDGARYRFDGAKELAPRDLWRSLSVLPGYFFDAAGDEVGRAVLRLGSPRALWPLVRSLGVTLAAPRA